MGQRLLMLVVAMAAIAILVGGRSRRAALAPVNAPPKTLLPTPLPPPRQLRLQANPNAGAPEAGTPQIDLLAILAVRRRITREKDHVYLDQLFSTTDSIIVRWPSRPTQAYYVAFIPDSTLKGWSGEALSAAQSGLQTWVGNSAGIILTPISDSSIADITVRWMERPDKPNEIGVTQVSWGRDGIITHANISLALAFDSTHAIDPGQRARAAAHEFGHALGLPHSDEYKDLMFARADESGPSRRDQATLLLLYTLPPGTIKTP